jgi:hypothetical protein
MDNRWDVVRLATQSACTDVGVLLIDFFMNDTPKIVFTFRRPGGINIETFAMFNPTVTTGEIQADLKKVIVNKIDQVRA